MGDMMYGAMLIGHMLGDYALQDYRTATSKSASSSRGILYCAAHSLIYTLSVSCCVYAVRPFDNILLILTLLWMSHFIIDKWSIAKYLLRWKGFDEIDIGKAGHLFMYAANDNALHLMLMFIIFQTI